MDPEVIQSEIRDLLERMGFGGEIETIEAHQGVTSRFGVRMYSDAHMLIGEYGSTLSSFEYIVKRILNKKHGEPHFVSEEKRVSGRMGFTPPPTDSASNRVDLGAYSKSERSSNKNHGVIWGFTIDINDYRMKRLEDLKQDVKAAAKEVRLYRKDVPMRFMSSFERRIVHLLLEEYPDITTESIGQEPGRRVVIKPYP